MKCYTHGFCHSMIDENLIYQKIFTDHGVIIGFDDDFEESMCDEIIDLKGFHLYPGFVDAHLHMLGYGEFLSKIHLNGLKTKEEVYQILDQAKDQGVLFALGYQDMGITKEDLDQRYQDQEIYLRHNDFHAMTVSSSVLRKYKINHKTGILKENDALDLLSRLPKPTVESLKETLQLAIHKLYSLGITGGHTDDLAYYKSFQETFQVFEDVLNEHPFRAHLLIHNHILDDYLKSGKPWQVLTPYFELGAVKMFYDGTMSSKTALMSAPYNNEKTSGEVVMGRSTFIDVLKKARKNGLTVAIHVIGDQGLDEVIDLLIQYPPKNGLIDRVIHAPWARKETLLKMKGLPISYDIQPPFLASDLPRAFSYFSITPDLVFPWKSYLNEGLILSGSSDVPVEDPNPLLGIRDAIYRRSVVDQKQYVMSEALTPFEAVKLYSTGAHAQSFLSKRGYLKKGYLADFTVCKHALETLSEKAFSENQIMFTIINDHLVYESN